MFAKISKNRENASQIKKKKNLKKKTLTSEKKVKKEF